MLHAHQRLLGSSKLDAHMETAPVSFKVFACRTREDVREYDYAASGCSSATSTVPCAATTRHMTTLLYLDYVSLRDHSSSRLHQLYCAYVVHSDASSRRSTSRRSVA
jgi:hypothetical protein